MRCCAARRVLLYYSTVTATDATRITMAHDESASSAISWVAFAHGIFDFHCKQK